jgi:hypothetical protein
MQIILNLHAQSQLHVDLFELYNFLHALGTSSSTTTAKRCKGPESKSWAFHVSTSVARDLEFTLHGEMI